jgi:hypothetical protein
VRPLCKFGSRGFDPMGRKAGMGVRRAYDSVQDCFPPLVFVFPHGLQEHFAVFGNGHLLVDEELVAGLVVWFERETLRECRIHRVDIDVHFKS